MGIRLCRWIAVAAAFGSLAACGTDDEPTATAPSAETTTPTSTSPSTSSAPTTLRTTEQHSTTTVIASTTPVTTAPAATELDAWISEQLAAGRGTTDIVGGTGTTARLIVAYEPQGNAGVEAAVLFGDGRVVGAPNMAGTYVHEMFGLGDGLLIVTADQDQLRAAALADGAMTWTSIDLGFDDHKPGRGIQAALLGDSVVLAYEEWELEPSTDMYIPGAGQGVVIAPDLTVTPMTRPADRIPLMWTVTAGDHALLMGIDAGADTNEALEQPWSYDVVSNEWSLVPDPEWLDCDDGHFCSWYAPHEGGDRELQVSTPSGIVKLVPDGTIGLYDPATATWTRLDDAPFDLSGPYTASVGRYVAVAPISGYEHPELFGTLGALDIESGTWATFEPDLPPEFENGAQMAYWEIRSNDDVAMVIPLSNDGTIKDAPVAVFDGATGEWRLPTPDDIAIWHRLAGSVATADLAGYV